MNESTIMDKLNYKFYTFLRENPSFGPVVPQSHNRYKVHCRPCEEAFNNPRIHVLRKHLQSVKHSLRSSVTAVRGLTKKEIVQRDKLLHMFDFLRFVNSYLVCVYCDLVFSCNASPSMVANHQKCKKHSDLKIKFLENLNQFNQKENNHHQDLDHNNNNNKKLIHYKKKHHYLYHYQCKIQQQQQQYEKLQQNCTIIESHLQKKQQQKLINKEKIIQNHNNNRNLTGVIYPGVIYFSKKDGSIEKMKYHHYLHNENNNNIDFLDSSSSSSFASSSMG